MTTYANICSVHIIHLLQGTHFPKRFAKAVPRPESLQSRCFEDSKQLNSHRKGRSAASLAIAKSVKIENCDHMPPYAIIWCHMSPWRLADLHKARITNNEGWEATAVDVRETYSNSKHHGKIGYNLYSKQTGWDEEPSLRESIGTWYEVSINFYSCLCTVTTSALTSNPHLVSSL